MIKAVFSSAVKIAGFLALGMAIAANAVSEKTAEQISERIKPYGKVCMEGDSSCGAAVAAAGGGARSPEDIYKAHCAACHASGAAGAPKFGDNAAWAPRIAAGIDTLHSHAIQGFNAMPPKGLCMNCSDDDIKATVDYMVDHSK